MTVSPASARRRLPQAFSLSAPPLVAGAILGAFLSRFWYELNPIRFAPLGEWPGAIMLSAAGAAFLTAQWWFALRRWLPADAVAAVHAPFALLLVYILWPDVDLRLAAALLLGAAGLSLALGLRALAAADAPVRLAARTLHRLATVALALIVFSVYVRTLGTYVGKADTFEFQVVAPLLGIAHPTGYPLYILIGKLFSLLPIGSLAFRVNLTSAVFATLTAVMVYAITARLGGRRIVAFIAALSLAVSAVMWSQAVVAEVYALNALIVSVVLALLLDLASPAPLPNREAAYVVAAVFGLLGLGISHHLTALLLFPAFLLAVLMARPRLSLRAILIAFGLFLLGLSLWLFLPLRWPALHDGAPMPFDQFMAWITGSRFGGALAFGALTDPARWSIVARLLAEPFGAVGFGLSVIGLIGLTVRQRRAALLTGITFALYVLFAVLYLVPDIAVFLIPAYLIMAIWMGVSVATIAQALLARWGKPWLYAAVTSAFLLMPILLGSRNFAAVDQRAAGAAAEAWGRYVLNLPIPDGAALLVDSEKIAPLYYLQQTAGLRPDLDIVVLGTEEEYRQQLDSRLAQGQPVFLARFLPYLPYALRSLGPLVEVSSRRLGDPALQPTDAVRFGDAVELLSASIEAGDPARVVLTWRALGESRPNLHVRLRLLDETGQVRWEDRGTHPVSGYYPTGMWQAGEIVTDYHEISFDPSIGPGRYTLQVGLFPPFHEDGLPVESGQAWWSVAQLEAPPADAPSLERGVRQVYGGSVVVTGVAPIGTLPRASDGQVRLTWTRVDSDPGSLTAVVTAQALPAVTPNADRLMGDDAAVRQAALDFHAPDAEGVFPVRLQLVAAPASGLTAKCGWLAPPTADCELDTVQVAGEASGDAANFDNQVLLTGWSVDRATANPGEIIDVDMAWRGLKTWDDDYTAFVHLVGPDGRLHGQVDAWPAQGTLPTSAWAAGQVVDDSYAVRLALDAPPGRYQIEVGWYLLSTLRRLPVLDAAGRSVDDRVIIGAFEVP